METCDVPDMTLKEAVYIVDKCLEHKSPRAPLVMALRDAYAAGARAMQKRTVTQSRHTVQEMASDGFLAIHNIFPDEDSARKYIQEGNASMRYVVRQWTATYEGDLARLGKVVYHDGTEPL